jgi:hypothetical protein
MNIPAYQDPFIEAINFVEVALSSPHDNFMVPFCGTMCSLVLAQSATYKWAHKTRAQVTHLGGSKNVKDKGSLQGQRNIGRQMLTPSKV